MYAKVFASLWQGTLYGRGDVQLVFIYLLAHSDADGHVRVVAEAISGATGMAIDRVRDAIRVLEEPDQVSNSSEEEGRRLERIGNAERWQIVNYLKYRKMRHQEDRKTQNREAKRRERARKALASATVSHGQPLSSQEEGEVEVLRKESLVQADARTSQRGVKRTKQNDPYGEQPGFPEFWGAYPRRVRRREASRAFNRALARCPDWDPADLTGAAESFAREMAGKEPEFVPHPSTWLNSDAFKDQVVEETELRGENAKIQGSELPRSPE